MRVKISEENAQKQIDVLINAGVVEIEDIADKTVREGLLSSLNILKRAICRGLLEITSDNDGNTKITQTFQKKYGDISSIEYKEVTGEAKIFMGKASDDNSYEKAYTLLGHLSGLGIDGIKKLKGVDLSIAECLSAVFLGI